MFTIIRMWLLFVAVKRKLKRAKLEGHGKLETGKLPPTVEKKLFAAKYEQYTQGGLFSEKRYFWTTAPVATSEREG